MGLWGMERFIDTADCSCDGFIGVYSVIVGRIETRGLTRRPRLNQDALEDRYNALYLIGPV
jgi:hypothetical protein